MFSWNVSPYWQVETDATRRSEVEVRFITEGPDGTRVELEHRHLDRHGDGWEGLRDGVAAPDGWPLYLQRYTDLLTNQNGSAPAELSRGRASAASTRPVRELSSYGQDHLSERPEAQTDDVWPMTAGAAVRRSPRRRCRVGVGDLDPRQ